MAKTTPQSSATTSLHSVAPLHAAEALIDLDNATVVLGDTAVLEDVSLCIHRGEFVGLIGPNGAGKTTLLKVLLGLWPLTEGKMRTHSPTIGYIPQRGFMHDHQVPISVAEVVQLDKGVQAAAATKALQMVGMEAVAAKRFAELSGGQQQRVLIAKALASQPDLLVLDEPTTGIDEQSQAEFYRILAELKQQGITILMVSHDVDMVLRQVTRVVCLNHRVLYDGTPEHFEADRYLPDLYGKQHRMLHHQHGASDV